MSFSFPFFPFLYKVVFGSCKIFSGKYLFSENAIFRKGKYFQVFGCILEKCFGKYFLVFGCVAENNIENTFSPCCSHFLSCQTNINIIPQYRNTKETKPRKKIHQIRSYRNTKETKPKKKNHQIRSN